MEGRMKYSIVIELEGDDELTNSKIEREIETSIKPFVFQNGLAVTHVEAASGSLKETFGVGL
jgi:hypothetical protein